MRISPLKLAPFARECVEGGRWNAVSDVLRSGLRPLREAEDRRRQFQRMLHETEVEADRDGFFTVDSVLADIKDIIEAETRRSR